MLTPYGPSVVLARVGYELNSSILLGMKQGTEERMHLKNEGIHQLGNAFKCPARVCRSVANIRAWEYYTTV